MNQVILNLLKNSIDALEGRPNGEIRICVSHMAESNKLQLRIRDNGPGIASHIAPRVFEPFFTTKKAGNGTGLGLPMCRRVLQDYDGTIAIDSTPNAGTEVVVEIPEAIDDRSQ